MTILLTIIALALLPFAILTLLYLLALVIAIPFAIYDFIYAIAVSAYQCLFDR